MRNALRGNKHACKSQRITHGTPAYGTVPLHHVQCIPVPSRMMNGLLPPPTQARTVKGSIVLAAVTTKHNSTVSCLMQETTTGPLPKGPPRFGAPNPLAKRPTSNYRTGQEAYLILPHWSRGLPHTIVPSNLSMSVQQDLTPCDKKCIQTSVTRRTVGKLSALLSAARWSRQPVASFVHRASSVRPNLHNAYPCP